jgi:dienelactone hydrolase
VHQVADRLAEQGFTVAVPDLLGGDAWPLEDFPPADEVAFAHWLETAGNTDKAIEKVRSLRVQTVPWGGLHSTFAEHCYACSLVGSRTTSFDSR